MPSDLCLQSDDPAQVDAGDAADRHENDEDLATGTAARDAARPAHVDDRLGEEPRGAAGRAHACRGGEVERRGPRSGRRRSRCRRERSCRAEPLRPDAARIVAERDERVSDRFDESGWSADVDERALRRRPSSLREESGVDAACATVPLLRLFVRQRDRPCRSPRARRGRSGRPACAPSRGAARGSHSQSRGGVAGSPAAGRRPSRRRSRRSRPAERFLPDEVAADRAAQLELVPRHRASPSGTATPRRRRAVRTVITRCSSSGADAIE